MIHITFNIDSNYVSHLAVTMISILKNNEGRQFTFHVIGTNLGENAKQKLTRMVTAVGSCILFYQVPESLLDGFSVRRFNHRISLVTYYRCFLTKLLPEDLPRVLYLDSDIIVTGRIDKLWETPLTGIGVAAIEDIGFDDQMRYQSLKYSPKESYFNAGVLLINLDFWRQTNVANKCAKLYNENPDRFVYNDQDLLNCVLHDRKLLIDLKWNVQDAFFRRLHNIQPERADRYARAISAPRILHFTNRKPWDYDSQHPLRHLYFDYLRLTPWAAEEKQTFSFANRLLRALRLLPFTLQLRRSKYLRMNDIHSLNA